MLILRLHRQRGFPALLLLVFSLACGQQPSDDSHSLLRPLVRDSSGIELIQYSLSEKALRRLSSENTDIVSDIVSGEVLHPLSSIRALGGVVALSDHRFAVGLRSEYSIALIDSTRQNIGQIGRLGEGPGEFRRISDMASLPNGGFVVYDSRLLRLTMFDSEGNQRQIIGPLKSRPESMLAIGGLVGTNSAGEVAMLEKTIDQDREGVFRDSIYVSIFDSTGNSRRVAGPFAGSELFVGPPVTGGFRQIAQPPFGARTFVAVCGSSTYVADNVQGTLERRTFGGQLLTRSTLHLPSIKVSDKRIGAYIATIAGSRSAATEAAIAQVRTMTPRDLLPVLSSVRCHDSGVLVELFGDPSKKERHLIYLSDDLRIRSILAVGSRTQLISMGNGYIILAQEDDDRGVLLRSIAIDP